MRVAPSSVWKTCSSAKGWAHAARPRITTTPRYRRGACPSSCDRTVDRIPSAPTRRDARSGGDPSQNAGQESRQQPPAERLPGDVRVPPLIGALSVAPPVARCRVHRSAVLPQERSVGQEGAMGVGEDAFVGDAKLHECGRALLHRQAVALGALLEVVVALVQHHGDAALL
eukprot:scaffold29501_cov100-Isochrysis_galbana.AAC.3